MEIAAARNVFAQKRYIPLIADGSISTPAEIVVALAVGAAVTVCTF